MKEDGISQKNSCLVGDYDACRIVLLPFTQTVSEGGVVREKRVKNGAAALAWEMFEKTGSIAYYMLFLELNNGRHY